MESSIEESGVQKAVRLAAERAGVPVENGGQSALARMFNPPLTPQAVQKWVEQGFAPWERCRPMEEMFDGEVTRYELNPQVFGEDPLAQPRGARRASDVKKLNS